MFHLDPSVSPELWDRLFVPPMLNFLYQSRGILAVLPNRDSPSGFRGRLTKFASRRRFDSRVRIVDYLGEEEEVPYVVPITTRAGAKRNQARMELAARAVQGGRARPFLELVAFEMSETLFGAEKAAAMFLYGVKRSRQVGNLVLGFLRPGLRCADSVRAMAETEFDLRSDGSDLLLRGLRPSFPEVRVEIDRSQGAPWARFAPTP